MNTKSTTMAAAGALLALCMAGGAVAQNRPGDATSQLGPEQRRELQQQRNEQSAERLQSRPAPRRELQRNERRDPRQARQDERRRMPERHTGGLRRDAFPR